MKAFLLATTMISLALVARADTNDWTALHTAASAGDLLTAKIILQQHPEYLNATEAGAHTPLHLAVFDGRTAMVAWLIVAGANVNAPDVCGWTPLHTAASRGEMTAAKLLIGNGADVNFKDRTGQTPLRLAVKYKHEDLAEWLRQQGAKE